MQKTILHSETRGHARPHFEFMLAFEHMQSTAKMRQALIGELLRKIAVIVYHDQGF